MNTYKVVDNKKVYAKNLNFLEMTKKVNELCFKNINNSFCGIRENDGFLKYTNFEMKKN